MDIPAHNFVTVDMRGLKAALVARAQAKRVSVSVVVRRAVAGELKLRDDLSSQPTASVSGGSQSINKLSIRISPAEAEQLDGGARRAGLARGAFLAGLLADVPALSGGTGSRLDCIAALTASSAELSTLSRNVEQANGIAREGTGAGRPRVSRDA